MQTLLHDIELDIQELKCLIQAICADTNPALRMVARRNIHQMQERLDELVKLLEVPEEKAETANQPESVPTDNPALSLSPSLSSSILAERIKPAKDLRHAISLNDSFRFTRELFDGDAARMNEIVRQMGDAFSLEQALDIFNSTVHPDGENPAVDDFIELLKRYFN